MTHDVIRLLLDAGEKYPDHIALRHGQTVCTYGELRTAVTSIGANLQARGVHEGDRFLFSVTPDPEGVILALGIIASGGVVILAHPETTPELIESRIRAATPKYAAVESRLYLASAPLLGSMSRHRGATPTDYRKLPMRHFFTGKRLPGTPLTAVSTRRLFKETQAALPMADPTGEAIIAFTSDIDASPKALTHSRASLGSAALAFTGLCSVTESSRLYTDQFMFGLAALTCGAEWEMPETTLTTDPVGWVTSLLHRAPTHTFLLPTHSLLMLNEIDRRGGLKGKPTPGILVMPAARVLPPLLRKLNRELPETTMVTVSGMTELLPSAIVEKSGKIVYTNGDLAGGVILGVTPRIDNLADEDFNEVVLSGDGLMKGLPAGSDAPANHKKDVLVRRGKSIHPDLYEQGIMGIGGISSCVIVGVPDSHGDDIVVLVVVPAQKEQNARRLRRKVEAHLSHVMDAEALPDVVIVQAEIQLTSHSNKPNRIQLRKDVSGHPEVEAVLRERAKQV